MEKVEIKKSSYNLNSYVWVKLNDTGTKIFNNHYERLGLDSAPYHKTHKDGDYYKFQMWEWMQIFGAHLSMGFNSPFEFTEVLLSSEGIKT